MFAPLLVTFEYWLFALTKLESNSESETDAARHVATIKKFEITLDTSQSVAAIDHTACPRPNLAHDAERVPILDSPASLNEEFHNTDAFRTQALVETQYSPGRVAEELRKQEQSKLQNSDDLKWAHSPGAYLYRFVEPKTEDVVTKAEQNIPIEKDADLLDDIFDTSEEEVPNAKK